jgi:hypothetical protein
MNSPSLPETIRLIALHTGLGPAVRATRAAYEAHLLAPSELCDVMLGLRFGTWPSAPAASARPAAR